MHKNSDRSLDLLLVTPSSRKAVYQGLSNELAAIEPPVWSGLIANYIQKKGLGVAIIDAEAEGLSALELAKKIVDIKPKLTVYVIYGQQPSASTQCMPAGREVACHVRDSNPNLKSLVMGTHASALPRQTLLEEPYDFVCQGEGPMTIYKLLQALSAYKPDYSIVEGLWYKDGDEIKNNKPSPNIVELDQYLDTQSWHLLDMKRYRAHNWHCFSHIHERQPYASIQTSLGCPYRCSFCCINAPFGGSGIRYWSPEIIIKQIDHLVKNYGIKNIKIPDEMFVLNEKHVLGICDLIIERGYQLNIWAYARVDTVKSHMLQKMKRAGFNWLALGIESASKYVRDGVDKGKFSDDKINSTVNLIRESGINVLANYIFGLPDDDFVSMQHTLDMAKNLNTEWANFYSAMAYPGSLLYKQAIESKWKLPQDWSGYSQHAYDCTPLPTQFLKSEEVLKFRDNAFIDYFSNPRYLHMIESKFGTEIVEHIHFMLKQPLKRKMATEQ